MSDSAIGKRDPGIETLRMLAMFFICLLHVLGQGGVLTAAEPGTAQYGAAYLAECTAYCGVNCYALISGYVGVGSEFRFSRLALLWLQVLAYELVISLYFQIVIPSVMTGGFWLNAVTPVLSDEYWYITAYFGMFLFIPVMNAALNNLSRRRMGQVLAGCFLLLALLQTVRGTQYFGINLGYSVIWLCVLYLAGGYIKKHSPALGVRRWWMLPLYGVMVLLTWLSVVLGDGRFMSYSSPTVVVAAVALLLFFANTEIRSAPGRRVIAAAAPTTLGIYLIHAQPRVYGIYIAGFAAGFAERSAAVMLAFSLLSTLAIFVVCSLIDMVRIKLFDLLRLKNLTRRLDTLLTDK